MYSLLAFCSKCKLGLKGKAQDGHRVFDCCLFYSDAILLAVFVYVISDHIVYICSIVCTP